MPHHVIRARKNLRKIDFNLIGRSGSLAYPPSLRLVTKGYKKCRFMIAS